jgi:hypothetical protein
MNFWPGFEASFFFKSNITEIIVFEMLGVLFLLDITLGQNAKRKI